MWRAARRRVARQADPIELLFPGGSLEPLERLYQESPVSRAYQTFMRDAIGAAVRHLPDGRRISVLEIGAGTGATTDAVLPVFDAARTRYVFSDVSPFFGDRAADKFSRYPFVEYQRSTSSAIRRHRVCPPASSI